ncbi:MAG: type II toxin-antitoxin system RelB/DinJ family antitoxin [Ruminococcus sp.]|nr:type II toxin-antitoxin system RelB/DinJ family antitoxin [Ruminococcus sp.]
MEETEDFIFGEANVFVNIDPEVKERAEEILDRLDIPMSYAVNAFLEQVIAHNGMPFDYVRKPFCMEAITEEEFNKGMQKAWEQSEAGLGYPAKEVHERIRRLYGIDFEEE